MHSTNRRRFVVESLSLVGLTAFAPAVLGWTRLAAANEPDATAAFLRTVIDGDAGAVERMLAAEPSLLGARDELARSVFALALLHGHTGVAEVIRRAGYAPDLHESALALDWNRFNELATDPTLVNAMHPIGGTAMHAAAIGGAGDQMWRVYAQCGVPNPDLPAGTPSPLRIAFEHRDLETAELCAATLLGNGADPNRPEPDGSTPLHAAAACGSTDLVEMLIRKSAKVDAVDAAGHTPLQCAERGGHAAAAAMLADHRRIPREHSSSRRAYDASGNRWREPDWSGLPLTERRGIVGSAHRDIDAVRAELTRDTRLAHAIATTTEAAVEAGAHMGNRPIVDLLLEHGAAYSLPTAAMRGDAVRVKSLLAEDPKRVNERGAHDFALLWYPVIGGGDVEIAEILLDAGASVEWHNYLGTTALHWACMRGQADLVALFIERGANVNRVGRKFGGSRRTPLQEAESSGHTTIADLLRRHGATA